MSVAVTVTAPEGAESGCSPEGTYDTSHHGVIIIGAAPRPDLEAEAEEQEGIKPLSDRRVSELTAYRTIALRDAVGNNPHVAMTLLLPILSRSAPATAKLGWR